MGMNAKRGVFAGLIAALVGVAVAGFAQVIENPAKPLAKNAGRVVAPEEVLAISDEGTSEFYFKWPHALAAGLKLPESALGSFLSPGQCALDGEFLWVVERSEDETFAIKKYRIAR